MLEITKEMVKDHKFDFENKTYVATHKVWGVRLLKHFTIIRKGRRQESRWRFIHLDGKRVSNVLIAWDGKDVVVMKENPLDPINELLERGNETILEFDDVSELFTNWRNNNA